MSTMARGLIHLAAWGSAALLAAAFLFQFLGWEPCKLCIWQRWPHAAAIAIGLLALILGQVRLAWAGAVAAVVAAGLALHHSGVERGWWAGPADCSGGGEALSGLPGAALLPGADTGGPALVMCDQLTPFLFGLSMANWNVLASLGLAGLWVAAALWPRPV